MASGVFLSGYQRAGGRWPWLMGGVTFLITTFFPPLNSQLMRLIPYRPLPTWLGLLLYHGSLGGIFWQLLHYTQEGLSTPFGALLGAYLPSSLLAIVLPLSCVLTWQLVVNRAPSPTAQRGLLAVVLATALALLGIGLLDLLVFGLSLLHSPNNGAALLGLVVFAVTPLAQALWVLPGLLIVGAFLATLQARNRAC